MYIVHHIDGLSAKFGNQLTESELNEMENSLFELTKILFETYLEMACERYAKFIDIFLN